MKIQNFYVGYYKDGKESLFYNSLYGNIRDLNNGKKVSIWDVDFPNGILPYRNMIDYRGNSKKQLLQLYKLDRLQKIRLERVFIGPTFIVTSKPVITSNYKQDDSSLHTSFESDCKVDKFNDMLLYAEDSEFLDYSDFTNLELEISYPVIHSVIDIQQYGKVFVNPNEIMPFEDVIGIEKDVVEIPKYKILEKYIEYKKRGSIV